MLEGEVLMDLGKDALEIVKKVAPAKVKQYCQNNIATCEMESTIVPLGG